MDQPPRPNDVASQTKRKHLPIIQEEYRSIWPQVSSTYRARDHPRDGRVITANLHLPEFVVEVNDPINSVLLHTEALGTRIPYLCPAHTKRQGGDWETGVPGPEEELCRRSSLSLSLMHSSHFYPLPGDGAIYSPNVVVFRGPADRYDPIQRNGWFTVPVLSVAPVRLPKLNSTDPNAICYSFAEERAQSRLAMQAGLKAVLAHGYVSVAISEFGLGKQGRNPPRVMAEMWRELFLYDPEIRGQFERVVFTFSDAVASTEVLIHEAAARAATKEASRDRRRNGSQYSPSGSAGSLSSREENGRPYGYGQNGCRGYDEYFYTGPVSDYEIFRYMFDRAEIDRVLNTRDPRYGLSMLTS